MKLAVFQGLSPAGDEAAAMAVVARVLRAAAASGAHMAVMPELYLPGYNHDGIPDRAQPRGGPWHRQLSALAREHGCGVTLGYAERDGARCFNSAVAFGADGAEIAHYRKIQLFGPRERALFHAGASLCSFDLEGRRAALLICYDIEFAPLCRALADRGVSLVLVPTANPLPFTHVSRLTVPSQAVNHGLTIAYANFCGAEGDLDYAGGSVIVGPDGEALARAGRGETLLVTDLDAIDAIPRKMLSTQIEDWQGVEDAPALPAPRPLR